MESTLSNPWNLPDTEGHVEETRVRDSGQLSAGAASSKTCSIDLVDDNPSLATLESGAAHFRLLPSCCGGPCCSDMQGPFSGRPAMSLNLKTCDVMKQCTHGCRPYGRRPKKKEKSPFREGACCIQQDSPTNALSPPCCKPGSMRRYCCDTFTQL